MSIDIKIIMHTYAFAISSRFLPNCLPGSQHCACWSSSSCLPLFLAFPGFLSLFLSLQAFDFGALHLAPLPARRMRWWSSCSESESGSSMDMSSAWSGWRDVRGMDVGVTCSWGGTWIESPPESSGFSGRCCLLLSLKKGNEAYTL